MRDMIVRENRLYVSCTCLYRLLRACKIKEFINALQCHKCFALEHMMKKCSVVRRLCEKFGESDLKKKRVCVVIVV